MNSCGDLINFIRGPELLFTMEVVTRKDYKALMLFHNLLHRHPKFDFDIKAVRAAPLNRIELQTA